MPTLSAFSFSELAPPSGLSFSHTMTGGVSFGGATEYTLMNSVVMTGGIAFGSNTVVVTDVAFLAEMTGGVSFGSITTYGSGSYRASIAATAPMATSDAAAILGTGAVISARYRQPLTIPASLTARTELTNIAIAGTARIATMTSIAGERRILATAPMATAALVGKIGVPAFVVATAPRATAALTGVVTFSATLSGSAARATGVLAGYFTAAASISSTAGMARSSITAYMTLKGALTGTARMATAVLYSGMGASGTIVATAPLGRATLITNRVLDTTTRATVVNSITAAVTEYTSYAYDSFCRIGSKTYGAGADGIYELDAAATDGAAAIEAHFETGDMDFGSEYLKRFESLYAAYRTTGAMHITVKTDEGTGYTYVMPYDGETSIRQRRVPVGKGLKGKYWRLRVANVSGSGFGIDTMNALAHETVRRIGQ